MAIVAMSRSRSVSLKSMVALKMKVFFVRKHKAKPYLQWDIFSAKTEVWYQNCRITVVAQQQRERPIYPLRQLG